jgi:TonB family protein
VKTGPQVTRSHLSITVANPNEWQLEAFLRLPIPPGAAVTRAVLHVGKDLVEGAFVARERARQIYRSITERRRDPALITWSGPDWIEASIFPVERKSRRTLELEWVEPTATFDGSAWYRVPVIAREGGEPQRPRVFVDGVPLRTPNLAWIPLTTTCAPVAPAAVRSPGEPFGYAFAPAQAPRGDTPRLVIVAETSRTMSFPDRLRQRGLIEELLGSLPTEAGITLLAVDWAVATVAENATPAQVRTALDQLDAIPSAGALDLEHALREGSARARAMEAHTLVFVGPGVDGFVGDGLAAPLRQMQEAGQTLVVVGGGTAPIADAAALTGGQSFPWSSRTEVVARVLSVLNRTPPTLTLPNAERFFPLETVTGETRWMARFVGPIPDGLARLEARDLEALWVRAHVAATSGRDSDQGVRHRVLTPLTSILVLESMADYGRWGLATPERPDDPRLAKASGILALAKASTREGLAGRSAGNGNEDLLGGLVGNQIGEAYGVGGLGLVGAGSGGGGIGESTIGLGNFGTIGKAGGGGNGSGYGRGVGEFGRGQARYSVFPGQANVRGSIDKEIIRRIIRRHLNEVKYCYDAELFRSPSLEGRLAVQFTIGNEGRVISSGLQSSTMDNGRVENCVVQAVRRWEFPRPAGGGIAIVSYPFTFIPRGESTAETVPAVEPTTAPKPADHFTKALAALRGKGELSIRLAKVAEIIAAPASDNRRVLAWWIVEQYLRSGQPAVTACVLAANLLRDDNLPHEASRILSEAAETDRPVVTTEFRRWGSGPDVKRLNELAKRK